MNRARGRCHACWRGVERAFGSGQDLRAQVRRRLHVSVWQMAQRSA